MNADWHHINTFYGYKVYIPEDYKYKEENNSQNFAKKLSMETQIMNFHSQTENFSLYFIKKINYVFTIVVYF